VQCLAVDAFLRGSKDKFAAVLAMGSKPKTIDKAVRKMKSAIQDQKSVGKGAFTSWQVSFNPEPPQRASNAPSSRCAAMALHSMSNAEFQKMLTEVLKDVLRSMPTSTGSLSGRERSVSPSSKQGDELKAACQGDSCSDHQLKELREKLAQAERVRDETITAYQDVQHSRESMADKLSNRGQLDGWIVKDDSV